jgi:hypothetical protein
MEMKVREVGIAEEKSSQQVEQELLDKHQSEFDAPAEEVVQEVVQETQSSELNEEDVLSYIGKSWFMEVKTYI